MKNKIKGILVMTLIAVIAICLVTLWGGDNDSKDIGVEDKGSYSYYYSDPSMPTDESSGGINFYDK